MAADAGSRKRRIVEAAQSIAFSVWVVAAVIIPVALLVGSYDTALLVVILVFFWQLLSGVLSSLWPGGRSRSRSRFRPRLTNWGAVYCAIAATFAFMSVQWGINLLYLTAAFLLAGALCASLWPWFVLSGLDVTWEVPDRVFAGEPFPVAVRVRNAKRLFSAFGLRLGLDGEAEDAEGARWPISQLRPGQSVGVPFQQHLPDRGMHRLHPLSVRTSFPFGVLEATREAQLRRELLVLPHIGHINTDIMWRYGQNDAEWTMDLRRADADGEFRSLREYQSGDNPRLIHWPTSARLQKLYVKEFEQRQFHSVLILLDAHAPSEDALRFRGWRERFESAVSFSATLAAVLTRRNVFHAFAAYCPDLVTLPYDVGSGHLNAILETLALAESTPEHGVADLALALGAQEVSAGGVCLVTAGPLSLHEGESALGPLARSSFTVDASRPELDEIFSP
jgi:uncharacterized protein (DUF58 family)